MKHNFALVALRNNQQWIRHSGGTRKSSDQIHQRNFLDTNRFMLRWHQKGYVERVEHGPKYSIQFAYKGARDGRSKAFDNVAANEESGGWGIQFQKCSSPAILAKTPSRPRQNNHRQWNQTIHIMRSKIHATTRSSTNYSRRKCGGERDHLTMSWNPQDNTDTQRSF